MGIVNIVASKKTTWNIPKTYQKSSSLNVNYIPKKLILRTWKEAGGGPKANSSETDPSVSGAMWGFPKMVVPPIHQF